MDPRLLDIVAAQRATNFADLAGSETQSTVRLSEQLINQVVARFLVPAGPIRDLKVQPHAGNRIDVTVTVSRPAFLPPIRVGLEIERQPELPGNPVLVFRLSGAGGMMRLAAPLIASVGVLPPGLRIDGDRLFVDLAAQAQHHGQGALLRYARQLRVTTEEAGLAVFVAARIP